MVIHGLLVASLATFAPAASFRRYLFRMENAFPERCKGCSTAISPPLEPSHVVPFLQHTDVLPPFRWNGTCNSTGCNGRRKLVALGHQGEDLSIEDIIEAVPGGFSAADSGFRARAQTGLRQTSIHGGSQQGNHCQRLRTASCSGRGAQSAAAHVPTSGRYSSASPRRSCRRAEGTSSCGDGRCPTRVNRYDRHACFSKTGVPKTLR